MASRGLEKSGSVLWGAAMGALGVTFVVAAGALFFVAGHGGHFADQPPAASSTADAAVAALDAGAPEEPADAAPADPAGTEDAGPTAEPDAPAASIAPAAAQIPPPPKTLSKGKPKPHPRPLRPRHR